MDLLRKAVEASSNKDHWAHTATVGSIITKQHPDFDSRTYGFAKLSGLMAATTLFDLDRRVPGGGKTPPWSNARDKPPCRAGPPELIMSAKRPLPLHRDGQQRAGPYGRISDCELGEGA